MPDIGCVRRRTAPAPYAGSYAMHLAHLHHRQHRAVEFKKFLITIDKTVAAEHNVT